MLKSRYITQSRIIHDSEIMKISIPKTEQKMEEEEEEEYKLNLFFIFIQAFACYDSIASPTHVSANTSSSRRLHNTVVIHS